MSNFDEVFRDADAVARYADGPPRFMPGYQDMQIMTAILMAETADETANILVLGAGGGLELKQFAEMHPRWRLTGVDPSKPMLDLARLHMGDLSDAPNLIEGVIDDAPAGPFDAACCLLTLHFLEAKERKRTLEEIRRRLKPGGAFVAAHCSFPQDTSQREKWLQRYAEFALAKGADSALVADAKTKVSSEIMLLDPQSDERLLKEAGFSRVAQFYAGFTWLGWVGYA